MNYTQINKNLYQINLDQKIEGFRNFINSWLFSNEDKSFLIDPGPLSSIETLVKTLQIIGIKKLDFIMLTHIHIDHAGGAGKLLDHYPDAKFICHKKGIEHMVDPSQLWKGSLTVLGEIAEAYGQIAPIPEDKIQFLETIPFANDIIEVIETPGHAVHHLSFIYKQYLFAGEVAGVYQQVHNKIYTRPATPPKFKLKLFLESMDKLYTKKANFICFGHNGLRKNPQAVIKSSKEQLSLWIKIIEEQISLGNENLQFRIIEKLMKCDKAFSNYQYLDTDIKKREDFFIRNSINGIIKYVESV